MIEDRTILKTAIIVSKIIRKNDFNKTVLDLISPSYKEDEKLI